MNEIAKVVIKPWRDQGTQGVLYINILYNY